MTPEGEDERPTGRRDRWKWAVLATAAVVLTASGTRALLRHLSAPALLAELPPVPDLSGANPAMVQQITQADAGVRARVHSSERVGYLGMVYHANLYYEQAARCYEMAARLDRLDHRWPYYRAVVYETAGQTEQSLPLLDRASELSHRAAWVESRRGNVALKLGRFDLAREAFSRLLGTETHHRHGIQGLAAVAEREGQWERVIELLAPALEADPEFGPARHALASAYAALGMPGKAREVMPLSGVSTTVLPVFDPLTDAIDAMSCSSSHLLARAATAQRANNLSWAGELLTRAVEVEPQDADAHVRLGDWYCAMSQSLQEAGANAEADHFERCGYAETRVALRLDPSSAAAHNNLGAMLMDRGELEESLHHLTRAIELDPNMAAARRNLGVVLVGLGMYEEAIAQTEACLALDPDDARQLTCLGVALKHTGDIDGAMARWYEAIKVDPTYAPARCSLSEELISRGDGALAAMHLRVVLRDNPHDGRALALYSRLPD